MEGRGGINIWQVIIFLQIWNSIPDLQENVECLSMHWFYQDIKTSKFYLIN
jgi:hypothetical protein